jgi:hypothetical protein
MIAHSEVTAGIGHNRPPETTLTDRLREAHTATLNELEIIAELANGAPKEITTDQQAADIVQIAADAGDFRRKLDDTRKKEKDPFLNAGREVDNFFREPLERADRIDKALMQRVTVYNRAKAEHERRVREESERQARDAAETARRQAEEAAAAGRTEDAMADLEAAVHAHDKANEIAQVAPSVADTTRIRTEGGVTVSTKTEWAFEITDAAKIDLEALRPFIKPDHIDAAVRAFVKINKGTRQIAGVRIFEDMKATRRR